MLKKVVIVLVFALVVCTIAGCTTTSTTNQTPSATTSAVTHDVFLEDFLATYKNVSYSDKNLSVKAFEVTWINSTSARVEMAAFNKTVNRTMNDVRTVLVFPTSRAAIDYVNAMNKTQYNLTSTIYPRGGVYRNTTGQAPKMYKAYEWKEGNPFNISEYTYHEIEQLDNLVIVTTVKQLSS